MGPGIHAPRPSRRLLAVTVGVLTLALGAAGCGDSGSSSGDGMADDAAIGAGDAGAVTDVGPGAGGVEDTDTTTAATGDDSSEPADHDAVTTADTDDPGAGDDSATGDDEPDEGGGGGSDLEAGARAVVTLCTSICEAIITNCGGADVGGSAEVCASSCVSQASDDLGWIASYNCMTDSCSAAFCWMSPSQGPLPLDPYCDSFCSAFDLCDTMSLLGLPEDEPDLCRAACSGAMKADETVSTSLACWTNAMDPTCDTAAFNACQGQAGPFAQFCSDTCAFLYNPQSEGYYCPAGTDQYAAWPAVGDCTNACAQSDTVDELWFWYGCMLTNSCVDPAHCSDAPAAPDEDCVAACDSMFGLCGGLGQIADTATCVGICNGVIENLPVMNPDPGQCILDAGTCPADDEGENGLFYGCLIQAPLPPIDDPTLLHGAWHVDMTYLPDGTAVPPETDMNHTFHFDGSYSETCYSAAIGAWEFDLETRVLAIELGAIVLGWFVQSLTEDTLVLITEDGGALVASHTSCGGPVVDPDEDPELGPVEEGGGSAEEVAEPVPAPVEESTPLDEVDAWGGE